MFAFFFIKDKVGLRPSTYNKFHVDTVHVRRCTKNAFHNLGEKAKHHLYLFQLFKFKTESDIKRSAVDLISDKTKIESRG